MKKMMLGITWQAIGFLGAIIIICTAAPCTTADYNGIVGLLGALLGMKLCIPLVVCVVFFIAGIGLCFFDIKKKNNR